MLLSRRPLLFRTSSSDGRERRGWSGSSPQEAPTESLRGNVFHFPQNATLFRERLRRCSAAVRSRGCDVMLHEQEVASHQVDLKRK